MVLLNVFEKKFNLERPDDHCYYFHDLRKEQISLDCNHICEGGVKVREQNMICIYMHIIAYITALEKGFPHFSNVADSYGKCSKNLDKE